MNQAPLSATGVNFYISGPRPARLFPTPIHEFRKGKYATAGGESGFMTVFEYDVRGHTMMIDVDTSFVRFTSITQALGKNKVNFGRLVKTCPALDPHITKLKGGYLSIQGTWLPFDLAKELSRRIAWEIRDHLVPLFGYDFPSTCLRPDSEGFGQLAIGMSQKRARKRHNNGGPHQTSCYGPSLPISIELWQHSTDPLRDLGESSVVGGQAIEHVSAKNSAVQPCYGSSQPATFHYSKGYGLESRPWYGQDYLESNSLESMWNSAQAGGGSVGLQVPISTCGATASPCLAAIGANGGSPILSSPPSSNASSSSNQSYTAAGYGLMVPPTVPSHSVNSEAGANQAEGPTPIDGSRSYASLTAHGYATGYGDANASLSTWNDATHASTFTLHVHAHVHFQPPDPESAQLFTIHDFGSDPFYAEQVERG
ncbi:uncharacterized protein UMAG_04778 [Mycosarcoma maydis]|uniref:HTH APSES-type domain-containing protein n=1 Tax=Mycosarcoma maydis TaxID=5270 RepID=A0A0D1DQM4_MYCMD|nr:uncharacterized protein UMAG_04778 [Ustilago maydis 521]KIS66714.1 hypothetical protein UMAG_04778 [Ustilago maydis 521]|eukprot:XP_011391646.1 hypothetical protein UMAG_04778 [Ustilago maydis 521]